MESTKEIEQTNEEIESLIEGEDDQLTVDVPVEVRAGTAYGCCKRVALA